MACLLAAGLVSACSGAQPNTVAAAASPAGSPSTVDRDVVIARLQRERDDAEHRARDARQEADLVQGQCQLAQHELDSLRTRGAFEDTIWYRLDQAEITENGLRQRLSRVSSSQRQALEATLTDVDRFHDEIVRAVRHVRSVPNAEWPRYTHDLESRLDGLDRSLRNAQ